MDMPATVSGRAGARDFDGLIGPFIEPGYRLAVTLLLDPDEARDAVQEAAIKAWRSFGRLREPEHARAWFLSIVANQCRTTMRRHWWMFGRNRLPATATAWTDDSLVSSLDVAAGMNRLAPEDRAILHMHFYMDLPLEEVGRVLGISTGAARSRVYRAAKRLRPELTEEELR
jgi:RNA polymerase sigma-70 factor (ECF subfamily)